MLDHQQRVVDEHGELAERLTKLLSFFTSATYAGLPGEEQTRLVRQSEAMSQYLEILAERIAAFQKS